MSVFSNIVGFVKDNAKAIGVVAASVTAFAATAASVDKAIVKVDEIKKEYENHIKNVETVLEDENIPEEKYSQEDAENDIRILKTQRIVKTIRAFVPATIIVGIGIIGDCMLKTHYILASSIIGGSITFAYKTVNYKKEIV